jgi:hypothetical protein
MRNCSNRDFAGDYSTSQPAFVQQIVRYLSSSTLFLALFLLIFIGKIVDAIKRNVKKFFQDEIGNFWNFIQSHTQTSDSRFLQVFIASL